MTFNWNSVPLENYIAIDNLRKHPTNDTIQRDVSILSLLTGKPESYYEEMKLTELQEEIIAMHKFMTQKIEPALVKKFTVKGRTFYVGTNFDEFTESQRRQLACFCGSHLEDASMLQITKENEVERYPELMAILVEEKTFLRKKLSFDERVKLFREHLPAMIAVGITIFFWTVSPTILSELALLLRKQTEQLQAQTSR